jgi:HTH-type transcriptional regulator / antitoxin HigA
MTNTGRALFPPGEFILDEIEARGWTQDSLADILGRSAKFVSQLIGGKKRIEPRTALELGAAFGTSAELWMNLESAYRLGIERQEQDAVGRRAKLYEIAPVRDMVRRRWIHGCENIEELEREVRQFFADFCGSAAARKSTPYDTMTLVQRAWLQRVYQLARSMPDGKLYSRENMVKALDRLHALTVSEHEVSKVPCILADMGIRFVVVEPLPRSKIDGAAMWLDSKRPVVAVSLRYDRIDGFWHTLCHELIHVLHGHAWSVDDDLVNNEKIGSSDCSEQERLADAEASNFLIPGNTLDSFITRHRPRFSKINIVRFANLHQIHPGIVVGQLQHRKAIRYSHSREMLVSVRGILTETAVTDGWGHIPQT